MKIEAKALVELERFLEANEQAARPAAAMAMNDITGGKGLTQYKKTMRSQIAFPAGYLEDVERFGQSGYATPARLETRITARHRPTTLARFATGGIAGQEGVTVQVKAGRSTRLKKAFMVRLLAGTSELGNLGLAVRVKPGQTIRNKRDKSKMVHLAKDVFLLYAPSVDQVFRSVGETETPKVLDMMGQEFLRQFTRMSS